MQVGKPTIVLDFGQSKSQRKVNNSSLLKETSYHNGTTALSILKAAITVFDSLLLLSASIVQVSGSLVCGWVDFFLVVCCVMCVVSCCIVLCCVVLCCVVLCCVVSCHVVFYCVVFCCAVLCCVMSYRTVLCCVLSCCVVSYCVVLCCVDMKLLTQPFTSTGYSKVYVDSVCLPSS